MLRTLTVMLRKEFKQFFRNPFLPRICVTFPLMVMLLMPLVATMEVRHIRVALVDMDHSPLSRAIAAAIHASDYLILQSTPDAYPQALEEIEHGHADLIIQLPANLYRTSLTPAAHTPATIYIAANAVNATRGAMAIQYAQAIITQAIHTTLPTAHTNIADTPIAHAPQPRLRIHTLHLFNPTLNYRHFMLPALMIMLIVMLCGFLPALNLVSEKERGTIEQINVSPISHLTFTLGKVIPYWLIGLLALTIGVAIAAGIYGLRPAGNLMLIYTASFLCIIIMTAIAIIVANFSGNMQQVMLIMYFFVMLFILMSGLLTPVTSMPHWAQNITYAIPPRYYVDILRATYLRGAPLTAQLPAFGILSAYALLLTLAAILTYRKHA